MKIEYTLLAILAGAAYAILVTFFPDFPLTEQAVLAFVVWALVKLGVEVVNEPLVRLLQRIGLLKVG